MPHAPLRACVAITALLTAVATASAQRPVVPFPRGMPDPIFGVGDAGDLDLLDTCCDLTDAQREAARDLVEDAERRLEAWRERSRAIHADLASGDASAPDAEARAAELYARLVDLQREARAEALAAQRALLIDLRLLLDEGQGAGVDPLHGWDAFERARLRRAYLDRLPAPGVRFQLDLLADRLVQQELLTPADRAALAPAIERWALDIDRRIPDLEYVRLELLPCQEQGLVENDPEMIDDWYERFREPMRRVREAQRRAINDAEGLLPPDRRDVFHERAINECYPGPPFREELADDLWRIRHVADIELRDEQRARIEAIFDRYERDRRALHRSQVREDDERFDALDAGEVLATVESARTGAYAEGWARFYRSLDDALAVLTPEQRERARRLQLRTAP